MCKTSFFLCSGVEKCGTTDIHYTLMNHNLIYGFLDNDMLHEYESKKVPGKYNILGNMTLVKNLRDMHQKESHFFDNFRCLSNYTYDNLSRRCAPELIIRSYLKYQEGRYNESNKDDFRDMVFIDSSPRTATTYISWNEEEIHWHDTEPHEFIPDRLHYVTPNAKIIFILREPVSRTYSDYRYIFAEDQSAADFHMKVSRAISWWKNCTAIYKRYNKEKACAYGNAPLGLPPHSSPSCSLKGAKNMIHCSPFRVWGCANSIDRLRLSFYHIYLREWLRVFPRENLLFLKIEDIYADKMAVVNKLLEFLHLPKFKPEDSEYILKHGSKNKSKMHEEMLNETKVLLEEFFAPMNRELSNLLKEDYYARI